MHWFTLILALISLLSIEKAYSLGTYHTTSLNKVLKKNHSSNLLDIVCNTNSPSPSTAFTSATCSLSTYEGCYVITFKIIIIYLFSNI